jgi:hypothetical protein
MRAVLEGIRWSPFGRAVSSPYAFEAWLHLQPGVLMLP